MWHCSECGSSFDCPEIKKPDAGMVSCEGILGLRKIKPVMFCPECLSTEIERKNIKEAG